MYCACFIVSTGVKFCECTGLAFILCLFLAAVAVVLVTIGLGLGSMALPALALTSLDITEIMDSQEVAIHDLWLNLILFLPREHMRGRSWES